MFAALLASLLATAPLLPWHILPDEEEARVQIVAAAYSLSPEQGALLRAIRRAENGAPHLAFGVADRRCNTYHKQALWTANTIRRRYTGDLTAFARRWCPDNWRVWLKNVRFFMRKQGFKK